MRSHAAVALIFFLSQVCKIQAEQKVLTDHTKIEISQKHFSSPSQYAPAKSDETESLAANTEAELFLTSTGENTIENGVFTARENVELIYGPVSLYADLMTYDVNTGWARAEGHARLFRGDGTLLVGDQMEYNTRTGEVRTTVTRGVMLPFVFSTRKTESSPGAQSAVNEESDDIKEQKPPIEYTFNNAYLSLENTQNPGFRITAKSVHHRRDINRTVFRNVTMYAGKVPVMWWPKITYQPGSSDFALQATPGFNSEWGAFLLLAYGLEVRPGLYTRPRLDFRSLRGLAGGLDTHWFHGKRLNSTDGKLGQGSFNFYIAGDSSPIGAPEEGRPDDHLRYLFHVKEKFYFTSSRDFYLSLSGDILSDATVVRDFFPAQYRLERQPNNHLEIVKRFPNAQASLLVRPQFNPFFETVEKLPEIRVDFPRQQILGNLPLYYSGQSSLARLKRRFASTDESIRPYSDYNATRLDNYHELGTPLRLFDALQLYASTGWRGTFYDDSLPRYRKIFPEGKKYRFRDNIRVFDEDTVVKFHRINGTSDNSIFRSLFTLNLEGSLKFHRICNYQKPAWGIDQIRHIAQPWFHFSYIPRPWKSSQSQIMQFDQRFGSTRLDPLSFPQYNSVDNIPERLTLRLGLDHRFQTKRDGQNYTLVQISSYIDIDPWKKTYTDLTSNLFNEIILSPVNWFRVALFSSTDIHSGGHHEYNTSFNWQIVRPLSLEVSHRFLDNSDIFRDSNQLSAQFFWRVNENWAIATRHTFEFSDISLRSDSNNTLRSHEYSLHRDLSSWRASLTTRWDNNTVRDEFSVFLSLTLKSFPELQIPLGYTAQATDSDTNISLLP
jgi:LPS-assembly protein